MPFARPSILSRITGFKIKTVSTLLHQFHLQTGVNLSPFLRLVNVSYNKYQILSDFSLLHFSHSNWIFLSVLLPPLETGMI